MLIVSVSVNFLDRVEDICIHNTGNVVDEKYEYELIDPKSNKKLTDTFFYHKRDDGYRPLLIQALNILENENIEERIINYEYR